jgi:hypothetical protein
MVIMPQTPTRLIAISATLMVLGAPRVSAEPPAWPGDGYVRQLVEKVLPTTPSQWDGYEFALGNCRGATYIAAGLLWRDGPGDRDAAAAIVRGVLDLQYDVAPASTLRPAK